MINKLSLAGNTFAIYSLPVKLLNLIV